MWPPSGLCLELLHSNFLNSVTGLHENNSLHGWLRLICIFSTKRHFEDGGWRSQLTKFRETMLKYLFIVNISLCAPIRGGQRLDPLTILYFNCGFVYFRKPGTQGKKINKRLLACVVWEKTLFVYTFFMATWVRFLPLIWH